MNFEEMKILEPEIARLAASAEHAGQHGASWWDVLLAINESLSKLVGRGAHDERLMSAACYEAARAQLFVSWAEGTKNGGQRIRNPSAEPLRPEGNDLFRQTVVADVVN